ncbi:ABC transporter substrate-binding protein [Siccirubricoccus sp. KC 17139]|uniref:ABC transporter substrate-binding protein n=1 Tax=Siccirubricoccus soli TaxID=2899147 RepID=A0ABT1CZL6_9PROT|nr:ABC transporter substrate-binding protein [Siccirubricoccus soli]MCO6415098.1 ABC transporter substrate-binding protein [Siccirubricoccus soli]MCP2681229.1 ABC transporter substrate-binding protein [Siccirubricoccus soli]
MRRRAYLALLGAAALRPASGRAQGTALPVIGYLGNESAKPMMTRLRAFRAGLAEMGYVEGRNVVMEFRWAEGRYERLPRFAAELVQRGVDVIVAPGGAPVALAAKSATRTIPIVFEMGGDPVALGVVSSLNRPEGNLTGVSSLSVEASSKRLELLHEAIPAAADIGIAVNPTSPTAESQLGTLRVTAGSLGLQLHVLEVRAEEQFEAIFAALPQLNIGGLVFTSDPFFAFRSELLAALALRHGVPAITQTRDFATAGGLMSYGGDFVQSHHHTGVYTGRVLKGQKPSDLPVQQITRLELLVNLQTAARFGISLPRSLLGRADEVIE